MNRDRLITRPAVESMIADGHTIVVYDGYVLRLDSWLEQHPGGRLAILHMVGRDATDEINVYHSAAVCQTMKAYRIGRQAGPWINMTPPIRGGIYHKEALISNDAVSEPSEPSEECDSNSNADDASSASSCDLTSDLTSLTSACSSADEDGLLELSFGAKPSSPRAGLRKRLQREGSAAASPDSADEIRLSPAEYTESAMQSNVEKDIRDYPSIDPAVQQDIIEKYRVLQQTLQDEGLYECPYLDYGKEMIRYTTLFATCMVALHFEWYLTSAVFLGLFWHQIMFTAHDGGHTAITHNFVFDSLIAIFIADFCCGLSMGWWKSSHNVHHLVTNQPEHDPDIQNTPLFATCPSFFKSIKSTYYDGFVFAWDAVADFMIPYQKYTYYPIMGVARFNLYLLSWLHVLSRRSRDLSSSKGAGWIRPTEIAFMACYWFLFGYCLLWRSLPTWTIRVAFVLVSHLVTMPLHVQITLSHWGMSTAELGESESFPQRQLRTTMDVDCPAWLDFIHGGLQFQAVHHLFPRLPRHNLRKAQAHVRAFCRDTGIPYTILDFTDGNKKVLGRLDEIGGQVAQLLACQKHMAETGESGLH